MKKIIYGVMFLGMVGTLGVESFAAKKPLKEKTCKNSKIGDTLEGGVVFNKKNKICKVADIDHVVEGKLGGCGKTETGADKKDDGDFNTKKIIGLCKDDNNAAIYCSKLKVKDKGGWYLPAMDELDQIYFSSEKISAQILKTEGELWTSTIPKIESTAYSYKYSNKPNNWLIERAISKNNQDLKIKTLCIKKVTN